MLKQQTLKGSFSLNGKGLHTGVKLTVTFNPAPEHYGYKIQRIDLDDQPCIFRHFLLLFLISSAKLLLLL